MRRPPAPTQRDVARQAAVSQALVSNYLNYRRGAPPLSAGARERIEQAIRELGYKPNAAARAMRTRRFRHLGYYLPTVFADADHLLYRAGLYATAAKHGYHITLVRHTLAAEAGLTPPSLHQLLGEHQLDGLIVNSQQPLTREQERELAHCGLPVVYLNHARAVDAVLVDHEAGARLATEHLLKRGHSNLAFLATWRERHAHYALDSKVQGFCAAMEAAGHEARVLLPPRPLREDELSEITEPELREWLVGPECPDGIVCAWDRVASHVFRALYPTQRRVPCDLVLVGGDNEDDWPPVPLTTLDLKRYAQASAAVEMALAKIENGNPEMPSVRIEPELIVRDSSRRRGGR